MGIKDELNAVEDVQIEVPARKLIKGTDPIINSPCRIATKSEAEGIWPILEATLATLDGYGLFANQIGIPKAIGLIKFNDKTYKLLNPRIVEVGKDTIIFKGEACFSFPKKHRDTLRFASIVIDDDNLGRLYLDTTKDDLLPIIFQHGIDHCLGRTIFDNVAPAMKREHPKISRNSSCACGSGRKYKKCCMNKEAVS